MGFDKIEDNMIIQKKGKKFLMIVKCQGINYDLMSGVEKTSVEIIPSCSYIFLTGV